MLKYESETIIIFDDEEKEATVYTCNKVLQRKLKNLLVNREEIRQIREDNESITLKLPKRWIKITPNRIISDEEKEKMRKRFIDRIGKNKA